MTLLKVFLKKIIVAKKKKTNLLIQTIFNPKFESFNLPGSKLYKSFI